MKAAHCTHGSLIAIGLYDWVFDRDSQARMHAEIAKELGAYGWLAQRARDRHTKFVEPGSYLFFERQRLRRRRARRVSPGCLRVRRRARCV